MFGEGPKDEKYLEVNPSAVGTDNHLIAGNSLYIAFQWATSGGGSLRIIKNGEFGRQPPKAPMITGHKGALQCFQWNPFNDKVIASGSDDCTVKVDPSPFNFKNRSLLLIGLAGPR